ncbi:unnamed protein product, partial [Ascophyllum nodosum]
FTVLNKWAPSRRAGGIPQVPDSAWVWRMSRLTRDGTAEPARETKFSGANGHREMLIFAVQLTTSRIDNLAWLIHTLLHVMTMHTYILHLCMVSNHSLSKFFRWVLESGTKRIHGQGSCIWRHFGVA